MVHLILILKGELTQMNNKTNESILNNISEVEIPELDEWIADDDQSYMVFTNDVVVARYDKYLGLEKDNKLGLYAINKKHYRERMEDIFGVLLYFPSSSLSILIVYR